MSEDGIRVAVAVAPTPRDPPAFLPYAAARLQASFSLRVVREADEEYPSPADKGGKRAGQVGRSAASSLGVTSRTSPAASSSALSAAEPDSLRLSALHDAHGRLVELALRGARVPCLLLKLVALCAPHQPALARLTLRGCRLDARALHQLAALLPASQLERLCLDDSPVRAGGYHLLLERPCRLRRLSLDRCRLGDAGAAAIAVALRHPLPASRTLESLSLATNAIGDEGARALAEALRSNRRLRHLDLADNRLTDAGAVAILQTLTDFQLTREESLAARRRAVERLQLQKEVYARVRSELAAAAGRAPDASSGGGAGGGGGARRRTRKSIPLDGLALDARAAAVTEELVGPDADPFSAEQTETRDGQRYCAGNAALCWLNVAYNSLGPASLAALRPAAASAPGLLRVVLEGNALPAQCAELRAVAATLEAGIENAQPKKIIIAKPRK